MAKGWEREKTVCYGTGDFYFLIADDRAKQNMFLDGGLIAFGVW